MLAFLVIALGKGQLACKALYTGSIPVYASHLAPDLVKLSSQARRFRLPGLATRCCAHNLRASKCAQLPQRGICHDPGTFSRYAS